MPPKTKIKKAQGKPVVKRTVSRRKIKSTLTPRKFKFAQPRKNKAEGSTCGDCDTGKMLPTQWNRLVCSKCNNFITL